MLHLSRSLIPLLRPAGHYINGSEVTHKYSSVGLDHPHTAMKLQRTHGYCVGVIQLCFEHGRDEIRLFPGYEALITMHKLKEIPTGLMSERSVTTFCTY
jgi:hypothetical protein